MRESANRAAEFYDAFETPNAGGAEIRWTFEVKGGPGTNIVETRLWGDRIIVVNADQKTGKEFARANAPLLGMQFIETFLMAMGFEPDESRAYLKDVVVSVSIKPREPRKE